MSRQRNALRIRLERLMGGQFSADDLRKLFMFLREESPSRLVREVAHFIAHPERDQGMFPEMMFDIFTIASFQMDRARKLEAPDELEALPHNISDVLSAAGRQADRDELKVSLKMKGGALATALQSLPGAFALNSAGRMDLTRELTPDEWRLFSHLRMSLVSRLAFTQKDLFADFRYGLRSTGLLDKVEKLPSHMSPWLMLIALEVMDNATMEFGGHRTRLHAGMNSEGRLEITMRLSLSNSPAQISFPLVASEMQFAEWCEIAEFEKEESWDLPIELSTSGKIIPLRAM